MEWRLLCRLYVRIVWLALADGRGHLVRAQLMRRLLAAIDVDVDLVTTQAAGVSFLEDFGAPARLLSTGFRLEYDERQDLERWRTDRRILRYLGDPRRGLADLRRLEEWAEGATLVVNDSFHPALLFAPLLGSRLRVVHVHGSHMREAVCRMTSARAIAGLLRRGFARVEHSLDGERAGARDFRLPPVVPLPAPRAAAPRLATVYLNPHFRDPRVAAEIEDALARRGYAMHAVGEGYAARPGWRATDDRLADAIAAADVFVSSPGMGALAQSHLYGTPLVAIVTDQPEQRLNLRWAAASATVGPALRDELARALDAVPPRTQAAVSRVARVQESWVRVFRHLIEEGGRDGQRDPGARDREPQRRFRRHRRAGAIADEAA